MSDRLSHIPPNEEPPESPPQPETLGAAIRDIPALGWGIIGLFAVAGFYVLRAVFVVAAGASEPADPGAWLTRDNGREACTMSETFVRQRLRSPSTASFPGAFSEPPCIATALGDRRSVVSSWVDAQNGFGATIRNDYTATLQQVERHRWIALEINIQAR